MTWLEPSENGVIIHVRLQPRASRSRIIGLIDDALKIAVTAPPVEGEANRQCLKILSKKLDVPFSNLKLISGATGRKKKIEILNISKEEAAKRLL